ncbi:MAG: DUF4258 domain-containing protein [Dehalococcoidia bacterium]
MLVITEHAWFEMNRRQVSEDHVRSVAENPQQTLTIGGGRVVHQSRYFDPAEAREMLLRVVAEEREDDFYVITVYKTSKIDKYWHRGS